MVDWTNIEVAFFDGDGYQHYSLNRADLVGTEPKEIDAAVEAMKKLYDRKPPQAPCPKDGESTYRFNVINGTDKVIELFYGVEKLPMVTFSLAAFIITR